MRVQLCQLDQALNEFSLIAGLIFQLSDDRLGLFGKSNLTGKDIDSDAKSGKKTFYAYFASQMLSGNDAKIFGLLYGKTNLKSLELKQLQEILTKAGVVKKVDQLMTDYVIKAKKAIKAFEEFPNLQNLFSETIEFLAIRDH